MFFELITHLESEYGWVPIVALVLVYIIWQTFKQKYLNGDHNSTFELNHTAKLRYHPFFSGVQYRTTIEIPMLEIAPDKPVKQEMFRDILIVFLKSFSDGFMEVATIEDEMETWSAERWTSDMSKRLSDIIINFNTRVIDRSIPQVALNKFNKWNGETLEKFYEYISNLGNSHIFTTNKARTNTFLYLLQLLLVTTIADAEKSLNELNGELKGTYYKGKPIEG